MGGRLHWWHPTRPYGGTSGQLSVHCTLGGLIQDCVRVCIVSRFSIISASYLFSLLVIQSVGNSSDSAVYLCRHTPPDRVSCTASTTCLTNSVNAVTWPACTTCATFPRSCTLQMAPSSSARPSQIAAHLPSAPVHDLAFRCACFLFFLSFYSRLLHC